MLWNDCQNTFDSLIIVIPFCAYIFANKLNKTMEKRLIGEIIEKEFRKSGMTVESFAEKICCTRQNVYDIFKRNSIDIPQLQLISKVLGRNFFADLARDPEMAGINDPLIEKELRKRWAVAQFFEVMPRVLRNLHIETSIVVPIIKNEHNDPLPDYALGDYAIMFTVGERLYDRFSEENRSIFEVKTETTWSGCPIDLWHNTINHQWMVDIKLDFKTEQEWGDIMLYIFDCCRPAIKMNV